MPGPACLCLMRGEFLVEHGEADEATVTRLFDEAAQARRGLQRELIAKTLTFLAVLSPEQRAKFVELYHQRLRPWGQRPQHP